MDIKDRFSEFTQPGYFSRVSVSHIPELHIGLDEKGHKAIELREKFKPRKITGTSAIDVNQYKKPDYNVIRFSLIDDDVCGLFYKFCDDLIEQTSLIKEKSEGSTAIINRFFQWKKLFINSKRKFLTEPEILGLMGEICFLRGNLAERIGLSEALRSWSGQELTHKDFSFNNQWFEVKSIHRSSQTVKISSIEQLESEYPGELIVYAFEKMSENYSGLTLNKLFTETCDMFDSVEEKDKFRAKVYMQGYEYHSYYDDFVYELSGFTRYNVDDSFPKLVNASLPEAICKASYELSLIKITDYIIKE